MSCAFEVNWTETREDGPVFRAGREFGRAESAELRQRLVALDARVPVRVDFARTVDLSDHVEIASDPVAAADVLNALDPAHPVPVPCELVLPGVGPPTGS